MSINRTKVLEYLLYILTLSLFLGKSYKVVAGLIIIVFFIDIFKNKRWEIFKDKIFMILGIWCGYLFISALWSVNYISAMKGSLELFVWCLLYLSIKFSLTTQKQIEKFLKVQIIVLVFIIINVLMQYFIGYNMFGIQIQAQRVTDLLSNKRLFAYIFPFWIGMLGAFISIKGQSKKSYILYSLAIIGILITIPLSGARGALLLLIVFLPIIAWMSPFRKWAFLGLGLVMLSSSFMVYSSPILQKRLETLSHPFEDQRRIRVSIWLVALETFKDNPLLGVGFRNFRDRQYEYYKNSFDSIVINPKKGKIAYHVHNPWLDILSEQGIVGLGFLLTLLFVIAKMVYSSGVILMIGSMGVWYSFSLLNSGFVLSSGRWSFFMILSISFFAIVQNYLKDISKKPS